MKYLIAFLAGAVSALVFHQGVVAVLNGLGVIDRAPFMLEATAPLGIPHVLSIASWGGFWGVVLRTIVTRLEGRSGYWWAVVVIGVVLTSVVAWFVVAPLKGQPVAGGWRVAALATTLALNVAWALGFVVLMRLATRFGLGGKRRFGEAA